MPNWMCSIVVLLVVGAPSRAQAVPADFLILIDSSGSMSKTQGSETRLDAAKTLATSLIKALRTKHRVGLARFAQLEQVVTGGEGKRVVYAEDEKQCEHASNLLAPVEPAGADQALRWLDGVEALGNPELVAVGDSPLVRAVTVAVEYLRGKRKGDPLRHCVNAYLIVITDGEDTCAGGDELRWQLSQLAAAAQKEDIHALVLSYTPDAAAAKAVAAIGQSAGVKPFGSGDSAKLLAAVQAIQGHLAPEACIASGVKPAQIGLGPDTTGGDGVKPCAAQGDDGGCGCVVAARPGPDGVAALLLLLGLALLAPLGRATVRSRRRRRLLLVLVALAALAVLALAGCGDDGVAVCPHDGGTEAGGPPAGTLTDPAVVQSAALARIPMLLASARDVQDNLLAPLLVPDRAFAALKDAAACTTLVRSIGLEPYKNAQRGAAGCLATRRCNSLDKALLLQACLKSKGVTADLASCAPDAAFIKQLLAEAVRPPTMPDLSAVVTREKALVKQLYPSESGAQAHLDALVAARDQGLTQYFSDTVAKEVATLQPLAQLDASTTDAAVVALIEDALQLHYFVTAGGKAIDPTLQGSPAETGSCAAGIVQLDQEALELKVEVVVSYAGPTQANFLGPEVVAAETTILPYAHFGETLTVGLADAAVSQLGPGIPAPSSSGCLRAFIEVGSSRVRGDAFPIGEADTPACPTPALVVPATGDRLYKVALRFTARHGQTGSFAPVVDRTLVNRYGYALEGVDAQYSGPLYSDETGRQLLPLRFDLALVSGLLSPAALLDAKLTDLLGRKAAIEASVARELGLPASTTPPADPPRPLVQGMIGAVVRHSPALLGSGLTLVAERPWLAGHVRRRGFGVSGAALDIVEQTIFDVIDAPLLVLRGGSASAADRLKAQIAVGALVTEAEAVALAATEKVNVSNAGSMLRDPRLTWKALDSSALDPKVFPLSVREEAALLTDTALIVTTGQGTAGEEPQIAWWRLDRTTGRTHSEIRYDGTFYGGAAEVKLIIDIDKCLYVGAAAALSGAEECDITPCIKKAWDDYMQNVALEYLSGALTALGGALGFGDSLIWGVTEMGTAQVNNIMDLVGGVQLPGCD